MVKIGQNSQKVVKVVKSGQSGQISQKCQFCKKCLNGSHGAKGHVRNALFAHFWHFCQNHHQGFIAKTPPRTHSQTPPRTPSRCRLYADSGFSKHPTGVNFRKTDSVPTLGHVGRSGSGVRGCGTRGGAAVVVPGWYGYGARCVPGWVPVVWVRVWLFGCIWLYFRCFGPIWPYFAAFGCVLACFGPILPYLAVFWPYLAVKPLYLALFGCKTTVFGQSESPRWWLQRVPGGGCRESLVVPRLGLAAGGYRGLWMRVHCVCGFVNVQKCRNIQNWPSGPK